jgi:glucose/arabinose dehydrogenase
MRFVSALFGASALLVFSSQCVAQTPSGAPLETRPANYLAAKPAFEGQTRAPRHQLGVPFDIQVVTSGLELPWGMTFLPDGRMLVTEKPGRLRIVGKDGKLSAPVAGVPEVYSERQGGLLDVAISPTFAKDGLVYLSYAEKGEGATNGTAAGRGRLVEDASGPRLEGFTRIYQQQPKIESGIHFGSRLVFAPDGNLFITQGDRSIPAGRAQAQQMNSLIGKTVRIRPDGSIPADNPYLKQAGVPGQIWSIGHRSVQAAAINPATGKLWTMEFGAKAGDEVNIVEGGKDYGWPTITYGTEYNGSLVGQGLTQQAGMEQPIYYWDPTSAPSGMAFYNANLFPQWKGSLFHGGHNTRYLGRLTLKGDRVVGEEHLLTDFGAKIRDVRVGPDGALYVLASDPGGRILRLVPKK